MYRATCRRALALALLSTAMLAVPAAAAPPPNDNFANATQVATLGAPFALDLTDATGQAGEPNANGRVLNFQTAWYRVRVPSDGPYTASASDSGGGERINGLAVYRGDCSTTDFSGLTWVANSNQGTAVSVSFNAVAGESFWFQVDALNGEDVVGSFTLAGPGGPATWGCPAQPPLIDCEATKFGTVGPDTWVGTAAVDKFNGLAGADSLNGAAGNDCVFGGAGPDKVQGASGDDQVGGGEGNDTVDGASGNDWVAGGGGVDTMFGGTGRDSLDAADGEPGDTLDCGGDHDRFRADPGDTVAANCEEAVTVF